MIHLVSRPFRSAHNRTFSHFVSRSINQSVNHPLSLSQSTNQATKRPRNQSVTQSTSQSVQTVRFLSTSHVLGRPTMFSPSLPSPCPVWSIHQSTNQSMRESLLPAVTALQSGGLVAIPTETVYGLAASAYNQSAIRSVYESKGRPSDNPLIVHVACTEQVSAIAEPMNETELMLAEAFWPGPLTMILKPKLYQSSEESINQSNDQSIEQSINQSLDLSIPPLSPGILSAGVLSKSGTVAVRVPSHPVARALISHCRLPLAAPSANTSGRPSPTTAHHVLEDLGNGRGLSGIVDGGATGVGLESTVVQVDSDGRVFILRPGGVTREMIEKLLGRPINQAINQSISSDSHEAPVAPGMKYAHYAPKADVTLIEGSQQYFVDCIIQWISQSSSQSDSQSSHVRIGVLTVNSQHHSIEQALNQSVNQSIKNQSITFIVRPLGVSDSISDVAASLFGALRSFDSDNVDAIFAPVFDRADLGEAVMNRLTKAAAGRVWRQ